MNILLAAFILAIWGATADWQYRRKGGKRPTRRDRILFLTALGLVIALWLAFVLLGTSADVAGLIGETTPDLAIVLFAVWELGRWRTRRKNPLPRDPNSVPALAVLCTRCGGYVDDSKFCPRCGKALSGEVV